MTLGASGAISGMLNVIPDLMQPLLDGIEERESMPWSTSCWAIP